jgi:hypothetical protein
LKLLQAIKLLAKDALAAQRRRRDLGVAELSARAIRAVEDQLVVRVEVAAPAVLVGEQPDLAALRALRDEGDLLTPPEACLVAYCDQAHARQSERLPRAH